MKLGLLTASFADTGLLEAADGAAANGWGALETARWPAADGVWVNV